MKKQEQEKNKYSELQVLNLLVGILDHYKCFIEFKNIKEWFEQFKNE